VFCLAIAIIKNPQTQLSKSSIVNTILMAFAWQVMYVVNMNFGVIGWNPVLVIPQIIMETTQFGHFPNDVSSSSSYYDKYTYTSDHYTHYMWIYLLVPCIAGVIGGFAATLHQKLDAGQKVEDTA
jgi:glycerol uptake facilitator-like aquaporin